MSAASLSLGPVLFLWDGPKWRDFYFRIADEAPVTHVTVGEIVCSKRFHFLTPYMDAVIERLQRAGKTVNLGSLALVMLEREAKQVRQTIKEATLPVEANDLSALGLLSGVPHIVGPLVNVYNAATARFLPHAAHNQSVFRRSYRSAQFERLSKLLRILLSKYLRSDGCRLPFQPVAHARSRTHKGQLSICMR